jgi:hypothetical protein
VTAPTKSAFLAAYRNELRRTMCTKILSNARKSINNGTDAWSPYGAPCAERAWHAIGMSGEPTIEALRRLEP